MVKFVYFRVLFQYHFDFLDQVLVVIRLDVYDILAYFFDGQQIGDQSHYFDESGLV